MRWRILGNLKKTNLKDRQEELIRVLFKNRDLASPKKRQEFLHPLHPQKLTLKALGLSKRELKKALGIIKKTIALKKEIIVYGDYDADGICGTAILWETLHLLGAKVLPYIPDRIKEGYGLNKKTIQKLAKNSPNLGLLITVDQGITAHEKVSFAQSLGLEVIISDHHVLPKTPPAAAAIVHTTKLSGSGVAWVFSRELAHAFPSAIKKGTINSLLELAAIGTVTDLLPQVGPNRSLVAFGLKSLSQTKRLGLKALFKAAAIDKTKAFTTYEIGFIIGPRLNASGRIGHALDSLRLLCTKNRDRAGRLAKKLNETNRRRQEMMKATAEEAREAWLKKRSKNQKLIFVESSDWEQGVIGLAASKLAEEFYLPVIVISRGKTHSKASARSIDGFNLIEAIREAENLLVDVGGHPMAAGFTVETKNLKKLREKLISIAEQKVESRILQKTLKIDCEVRLSDLSLSLFDRLNNFAPFGISNSQPDFVSRKAEVVDARLVGRDQRHLKLTIRDPESKQTFGAIGFGMKEFYEKLLPEKKIDLAYNLIIDNWTGTRKLQLKLKDLKI
jgi:single-stranded-DNA-specific exonuclease